MAELISTHCIAPATVIRGDQAWNKGQPLISRICQQPILLGRSAATARLRQHLFDDLGALGLSPQWAELEHDCCEENLQDLLIQAKALKVDGVVTAGGGKVLDAGKLLAHRLKLPCITVPLSASTCAGWTALANIYSAEGAFQHDEALARCPELLIFDHGFVRQAPPRTLASGIADALAKWYEASVSSGASNDGLIQQAVQMARVLRDQLLIDAAEALENTNSPAWERVAEACALTAGVIGGLGGARCRTVAAHAVHNGLTQLQACHGVLHGEKVGFGILVQLRLEENLGGHKLAGQARRQLMPLMRSLDLPISLEDLGLAEATLEDLRKVCRFACREGSDLHHLPFEVSSGALLEALIGASEEHSIKACSKIASSKLGSDSAP